MVRHITRVNTTDALGRLYLNEALTVQELRIYRGTVLKSIEINICPENSGLIVNAGFPVVQVEIAKNLINTVNNAFFELNQNKGYKINLEAYVVEELRFGLAAMLFSFDGGFLSTETDVSITYTLTFDMAQKLR